jgi:hypothetical protein
MLREKTLAKPASNRSRRRELRPAPADWTRSSLGERIDHICRLRGWSQNRLGQQSGYASGVISRLADREATIAGAPETLARVAKAAEVNVVLVAGLVRELYSAYQRCESERGDEGGSVA